MGHGQIKKEYHHVKNNEQHDIKRAQVTEGLYKELCRHKSA